MEDAVGAAWLQYIFMLLLFFLVSITLFGIHNIQMIDFNSYVETQIQRQGGITVEAQEKINEYSEKHFAGRYSAQSLSGNEKVPFGTEVHYEIVGDIRIFLMSFPNQIVSRKGSTISLVR